MQLDPSLHTADVTETVSVNEGVDPTSLFLHFVLDHLTDRLATDENFRRETACCFKAFPPEYYVDKYPMLLFAIFYRSLGWSDIPVTPRTKQVMVKWKPYQDRLPTYEEIYHWYVHYCRCHAGIAVVLGPVSGLFAVDVDGTEAHRVLCDKIKVDARVLLARSGSRAPNKYHLFYSCPPVPTNAKFTPHHEKLEYRGNRGIIVSLASGGETANRGRYENRPTHDHIGLFGVSHSCKIVPQLKVQRLEIGGFMSNDQAPGHSENESVVETIGCGKTRLLKQRILTMFGNLALVVDTPTEAGLRQALDETKLPTMIDEFDSCRQIEKTLELFRTAGHGGTIIRGSQNHEAREFHIRHIIWIAGIQLGMFKEQDFNRFIRIDLPRLEIQADAAYVEPTIGELVELRNDMIAMALRIQGSVRDLADRLVDVPVGGVPRRMVQNFAAPAAVYCIAMQGADASTENAEAVLREMLEGREMPEILQSRTEHDLLQDILFAKVPDGISHVKFVGEIINEIHALGTGGNDSTVLQQYGLKIIRRNPDDRHLFIVPKLVRQYLLRDTPWGRMELDPILRQISGATRSQQRMSRGAGGAEPGNPLRGWLIPFSSIHNHNDNQLDNETE